MNYEKIIQLKHGSDSLISQIPEILGWTPNIGFFDKIDKLYYNFLSGSLGIVLGIIMKKYQNKKIIDDIRRLSNEEFFRILTAPQTCFTLLKEVEHPDKLFQFLSMVVRAEFYRRGSENIASDETWSCTGDTYIPKGEFKLYKKGLKWKSNSPYFAPVLKGTSIIVDYCSPFVMNSDEEKNNQFSLTLMEMNSIVQKLNDAMTNVSQINNHTFDFISHFTKVISICKTEGVSFQSSSTNGRMGKIDLINPHLKEVNHTILTNALVHETIHTLLYIIELEHPFLLDRSKTSHIKVLSPWTRNRLPIHSYLHACLVWFGLWKFWNMANEFEIFPKNEVHQQMFKSYYGYTQGSLLEPLSDVKEFISPHLQNIIYEIQKSTVMFGK